VFTVHANLSGHPALSIPIGMTKNNFFASAQFIGPYFSDRQMLHIADKLISN